MESRVLKYFLAVAREQTFLGAAEALHVTQPKKFVREPLPKNILKHEIPFSLHQTTFIATR